MSGATAGDGLPVAAGGDGGGSYEMLFCCDAAHGGPVAATELEVDFAGDGAAHRRRPHAPTEHRIEELWAAKLAANPKVFNGSKFRLGSGGPVWLLPCAGAAQSGGAAAPRLRLQIGLTDYREYIGTNLRGSAELQQLIDWGVEMHGERGAALGGALGVETLLFTTDAGLVLLRRSDAVATHAGLYNGPSGHPEPVSGRFLPIHLFSTRRLLTGILSHVADVLVVNKEGRPGAGERRSGSRTARAITWCL
jgi:hypothetical protein